MQCDQMVTIDSCCNPSQCAASAAYQHAALGLGLCAEHYGNAVKYAFDNEWNVAGRQVPFPAGWTSVEVASEAGSPSSLVSVEEVRPSGLIVESGSVTPSGLVIERL
jgi:hypothetical protein